ncbi:riboflavin-binding protein [Callorhinchus milii]|uniref:Riboflavin-binding protein-like n=1 Tax=Callorhinchus milii TaxID=7868 RepID=A0A4W3H3K3_CALMI|nr:riboflavin-binding protein [Callorhinchus milii]|eukprot:gi/632977432/ref/XP_007905340.1/ PREDICTED: riboflavin-binding protein-like [Callorhinchus milii]
MSAKHLSVAILVLCGAVSYLEASCLAGRQHKGTPGPEADLHECPLYSDNACCRAESLKDDLPNLPGARINDFYWNRCGLFSPKCEQFMKQMACFYLCSPDTALWVHSINPTSLHNVPLCQGFCDQWYSACESDLTCTKDWLTEWKSNTSGSTCSGKCTPFGEVYKDGKDLCESMWGDSIKVRSCNCLNLNETDKGVIETLRRADSREDSTKRCLETEAPCRARRSSLLRKLRRSVRKRSIFVEEMEGSGSGFQSD